MDFLTTISEECRKLGTKFRILNSDFSDDDSRGHSDSDSLKKNNKEVSPDITISRKHFVSFSSSSGGGRGYNNNRG